MKILFDITGVLLIHVSSFLEEASVEKWVSENLKNGLKSKKYKIVKDYKNSSKEEYFPGCWAKGTLVNTSNNLKYSSFRPIETVYEGLDYLTTFNTKTEDLENSLVVKVGIKEVEETIKLTIQKQHKSLRVDNIISLRGSFEQKLGILTSISSRAEIKFLTLHEIYRNKDKFYNYQWSVFSIDSFMRGYITDIQIIEESVTLYDIVDSGKNHTYFVDDFLAHNLKC